MAAAADRQRSRSRRDSVARSREVLETIHRDSPFAAIATRAVEVVGPRTLTDREQRLLALAEQLAFDGERIAFASHAAIYLALACCSWANASRPRSRARSAALLAALAASAETSENLREVMGLDEKLTALGRTEADPELREVALALADGRPSEANAFERILARIEARDDA